MLINKATLGKIMPYLSSFFSHHSLRSEDFLLRTELEKESIKVLTANVCNNLQQTLQNIVSVTEFKGSRNQSPSTFMYLSDFFTQ